MPRLINVEKANSFMLRICLAGINTFWVAFNVGHGLQGIAVALCVACNCQVLRIYTRTLRRTRSYSRKTTKYCPVGTSSELSKSTSLQLLTWEPTPDAV
jgi:hypothetical protein